MQKAVFTCLSPSWVLAEMLPFDLHSYLVSHLIVMVQCCCHCPAHEHFKTLFSFLPMLSIDNAIDGWYHQCWVEIICIGFWAHRNWQRWETGGVGHQVGQQGTHFESFELFFWRHCHRRAFLRVRRLLRCAVMAVACSVRYWACQACIQHPLCCPIHIHCQFLWNIAIFRNGLRFQGVGCIFLMKAALSWGVLQLH